MVFVPRRRRSLSGVGAATPISGADGQARHQGSAEAASNTGVADTVESSRPGAGGSGLFVIRRSPAEHSLLIFFFFLFFNSIDILMQMLAVAISFPILSESPSDMLTACWHPCHRPYIKYADVQCPAIELLEPGYPSIYATPSSNLLHICHLFLY